MYTLEVTTMQGYAYATLTGFNVTKKVTLLTFDQAIRAANIFTNAGHSIILRSI